MTHKRHYQLLIDGELHYVYGDGLPLGDFNVIITFRTTKKARKPLGPNYDPHDPNSIKAALLYASVHQTCLTMVWQHLFDHNGVWVRGTDMRYCGDAWRVRISELTDKLGWPIERRSPDGPGVWWYRMNLQLPPPKKLIRRQPRV